MIDESRTTAYGLIGFAAEYAAAFLKLGVDGEGRLEEPIGSNPARLCVGVSIELSLKAYLRWHNVPLENLKKIGHNLVDLRKACIKNGWKDNIDADHLFLFSDEYVKSLMRYIVVGRYQLVTSSGICDLMMSTLHGAIEEIDGSWRFVDQFQISSSPHWGGRILNRKTNVRRDKTVSPSLDE